MLCSFGDSIVSILKDEIDQDNLLRIMKRQADYKIQEKLKNLIKKTFGRDVCAEEISEIFQVSGRYFSVATLVYSLERMGTEVGTTSVFFYKTSDGQLLYQGTTHLSFSKGSLFIRKRELALQKEGIGLEIQCRLEKFCRENKIWEIRNIAASEPMKQNSFFQNYYRRIGAYVWARYGFAFDYAQTNSLELLEKFVGYCLEQKVEPENFSFFSDRPLKLALLDGFTQEGQKIKIGKQFLLNSDIEWWGIKDLSPDSLDTKEFLTYLEERDRQDLIKRYF